MNNEELRTLLNAQIARREAFEREYRSLRMRYAGRVNPVADFLLAMAEEALEQMRQEQTLLANALDFVEQHEETDDNSNA